MQVVFQTCIEMEITPCELVASFHECQHHSPWPSWRPRTVAEYHTVRKIRGMPRQPRGWHGPDHCLFYSCLPEMDKPPIHAFFPHISRGSADQQNSQPVKSLQK